MARSVGQRLNRMNAITSSVALVLACGAFLAYEIVTFSGGMVRRLETQAEIIALNAQAALLFGDDAAANETLAALRAEPHIVSAHVFLENGKLFASYVRPHAGSVDTAEPPRGPDGHHFGGDRLVVSRRIVSEGVPVAHLYLRADLDEQATRLWRYGGIVAGVLFFSLCTGLLLASRLQRRITRPILALADAARAVSVDKRYAVRVDAGTDDELARLAATFNEMLTRIEQRDQELSLARDQLEWRVDERTRDLTEEIAERMRLAEELRERNAELSAQNQRVQEATRMKSEFLANMSHELRTPLNAIIGFTQLLHGGQVPQDSPQHQEFLGDVLSASYHLLKLINDVLDLSKVEAGKMEFTPETVDVRAVVEEVTGTVRPLAAEKRLKIRVEIDPVVGTVFLDRSKWKQVLYNYVSNAIKFTGDDGTISIRVTAEGDTELRLEVEDTGIGIPEHELGGLFAEFHQLDATSSKKYAGTGLGLALTRRILQAQGGRHGVRSTPGKGSTFIAVLPRVARRGSMPPAVEAVVESRREKPTVLVVEDDERDLATISQILVRAGYAVESARTGEEALARVKVQVFDRITLDLVLPDVTGWEVLHTIRHASINRETPVIITTGAAEDRIGSAFAVHDYLVKPLRADDLVEALSQATAKPGGEHDVLVIDDDPQALQLMDAALRAIGYGSICERSGAAGLLALTSHRPAAIIVDLLMPEMDGFEFLRQLRATPHGREIPVIVWTMKDLTSHDLARLGTKAQAAMPKGADTVRQLLEELSNLMPRDVGRRSSGGTS